MNTIKLLKSPSVLNRGNTFFFDKQKKRTVTEENGSNKKYLFFGLLEYLNSKSNNVVCLQTPKEILNYKTVLKEHLIKALL